MNNTTKTLLFVLFLVVTLISCGKGHNSGLNSALSPLSDSQTREPQVEYLAASGKALRPEVHFDYGLSRYPSLRGFTVVPMSDDFTPMEPYASGLTLSVEERDGKTQVDLFAENTNDVFVHLRYDPETWTVDGVGGLNAFPGAEDFLFFAAIPEPGVLVIKSMPVGSGMYTANGKAAEIFFKPGPDRSVSTDKPPTGRDGYNVIWYKKTYGTQMQNEGWFYYCLDGVFGDAEAFERDGELSGGERGTPIPDNCAFDIALTDSEGEDSRYGETFDSEVNPIDDLYLKWTERLVGDYDNNGEVGVPDVTPIAVNMTGVDPDPPDPNTHYAQGAVVDGNGIFQDMPNNMVDSDWLEVDSDGLDLFSYFYFDESGWDDPPGFNPDKTSYGAHGITHRDNGIDGFCDGFVYEYLNWQKDQDAELEGYYSEPEEEKRNPGDIAPIALHYLEKIDGYKIWTMRSDSNYDDKEWLDPGNHSDIGQIATIYRNSYGDDPWTLETDECYRRAEISYELSFANFRRYYDEDVSYDIVIEPFALNCLQIDVPSTILRNAIEIEKDPVDDDLYGPAYFNMMSSKGIASVNQVEQYTLDVMYWDADDRDSNAAQDETNGEVCRYDLYVHWEDDEYTGDDPEPEEVFSAEGLLQNTRWVEDDNGTNNMFRSHTLTYTKDTLPYVLVDGVREYLPLDKPGYQIWFGVRAFFGSHEEYTFYGTPPQTPDPNTNIYPSEGPLVVQDFMSPMFFDWREYEETGEFNDTEDFLRVSYGYDGAIVVYFHPAVDEPARDLTDEITYKLYWSDESFELPPGFSPSTSPPPVALAYSENYDSEGPLPGLNEEAYQFLVDGLDPGVTYYFYIEAVDSALNTSATQEVHWETPWTESSWCITLEADLPSAYGINVAEAGGDIAVEDGDVYVLYPKVNEQGFFIPTYGAYDPVDADYVFERLIDGEPNSGESEAEILNSSDAVPWGYGTPKMAFQFDENLDVKTDVNGCAMPIVSFVGSSDVIGTRSCNLTFRYSPGSWSSYMLATPSGGNTAGSPTICSHKFYDPDEDEWAGAYELPYVQEGELREYNAPWDVAFANWGNSKSVFPGEHLSNGNISHGSDVILKSVFPTPLVGGVTSTGDVGNLNYIYMLTGTYFWHLEGGFAKIWKTGDPLDGWSFLGDITGYLTSQNGCVIAPVGMEAVGWYSGEDYEGDSLVYVVYNTAQMYGPIFHEYFSGELKLAYAYDEATSQQPLTGWDDSAGTAVIDDNYTFDSTFYNSLDLVDLQVRNPSAKATSHLFDRLGCSYVTDGTLKLAETNGTDEYAVWQKLSVDNPYDEEAISHSRILWQKLVYLEVVTPLGGGLYLYEDVPYIIFARRKDASEDLFDIMLWKRDGF